MTQRKSRIVLILLLVIPMIALLSADRHHKAEVLRREHEAWMLSPTVGAVTLSPSVACVQSRSGLWPGHPMRATPYYKVLTLAKIVGGWKIVVETYTPSRFFDVVAMAQNSSAAEHLIICGTYGGEVHRVATGVRSVHLEATRLELEFPSELIRKFGDVCVVEVSIGSPVTAYPAMQEALVIVDDDWFIRCHTPVPGQIDAYRGGEYITKDLEEHRRTTHSDLTGIVTLESYIDSQHGDPSEEMAYLFCHVREASSVQFSLSRIDGEVVIPPTPVTKSVGWSYVFDHPMRVLQALGGPGLITLNVTDSEGTHVFYYASSIDLRSRGTINDPRRVREEVAALRREYDNRNP